MPNPERQTEKFQILVIDDDPLILRSIQGLLLELPVKISTAINCSDARAQTMTNPEFAILLCDHLLPDGNGVDFLREMRTRYPTAIRILMTGVYDKNVALEGVNTGEVYRFLIKPFSNEELIAAIHQSIDRFQLQTENARLQQQLVLQNEELKLANTQLERRVAIEEGRARDLAVESGNWRRACQSMVDLCLEFMQRLDTPLFMHSQRVARLSVGLAREMGYPNDSIDRIELAASLHDLGLLGASPALQANQRDLALIKTPLERDQMTGHAELSAALVKFLPVPEVVQIISEHHELYDGSGYPKGLAGEQINQLANVLIVADAYDEQRKRDFALSNIEMGSGKLYHPEVVRALIRLLGNKDFKLQLDRPALLSELKPGMKLATSIYTSTGMLLVKQGQVLTSSIISKLQLHDSGNMISQTIYVQTDT